MTDHPPAIPAIQVQDAEDCPWKCKRDATYCLCRVPLGLSPEQPARLSGEPMP